MNLQMQMGSRAMTGIPADGNQLSLSDREVKRSKVKVYLLVTPPVRCTTLSNLGENFFKWQ